MQLVNELIENDIGDRFASLWLGVCVGGSRTLCQAGYGLVADLWPTIPNGLPHRQRGPIDSPPKDTCKRLAD